MIMMTMMIMMMMMTMMMMIAAAACATITIVNDTISNQKSPKHQQNAGPQCWPLNSQQQVQLNQNTNKCQIYCRSIQTICTISLIKTFTQL